MLGTSAWITQENSEERVLILAPTGRDARLLGNLLAAADFLCEPCPNLPSFVAQLRLGAGAGILAEEALHSPGAEQLLNLLKEQPPWSDLPLILLESKHSPAVPSPLRRWIQDVDAAGNLVLLERPVRAVTLTTAVRAALRARRRQYEVRRVLDEKERLIRSNEELKQLTWAASHDLREPLRTIASYTQLLTRRYESVAGEGAGELAAQITQGVHRLSRLIDALLDFGRIDRGPAPSAVLPLHEALDDALADLDQLIREGGATIECSPLPVVNGDCAQLSVVFQNLIKNAIKHRGSASPQIRISAARNGSAWRIAVQDNGPGVEPAYRETIFKLFKRLDPGNEGAGIGLTISKKIIEKHGGRIWVESEPGMGSTFFFTLPGPEDVRFGAAAARLAAEEEPPITA